MPIKVQNAWLLWALNKIPKKATATRFADTKLNWYPWGMNELIVVFDQKSVLLDYVHLAY